MDPHTRKITGNKKQTFTYLGTVAVVLLLSASLVVPTLSAYADDENGKIKSKNGEKSEQKDRKGKDNEDKKGKDPKNPNRCENFVPKKYNKHCSED